MTWTSSNGPWFLFLIYLKPGCHVERTQYRLSFLLPYVQDTFFADSDRPGDLRYTTPPLRRERLALPIVSVLPVVVFDTPSQRPPRSPLLEVINVAPPNS